MAATRYKYTAVDHAGVERTGRVDAQNENDAFQRLSAQGLTPIQLRATGQGRAVFSHDRVSTADIAALTRELSVLVEARIPLGRGLVSIAEHERKRELKAMVMNIAAQIESGSSISDAVGAYGSVFGEVFVESMRAAERSGNMGAITDDLASMLERRLETGRQVRRALSYPAVVLSLIATAIAVIVVVVVPKFAMIFESNGMPLPIATRIVQSVGFALKSYWWLFLGLLAGGSFLINSMWRSETGRRRLEGVILRIPYVGSMVAAAATARFSRVLGIALESGLDLPESIEIGGRATGWRTVAEAARAMAERLRRGEPLDDVLSDCDALPSFAKRLIGAGKEAREVSDASSLVARHFDRLTDNYARNINTFVEPIMTVGLAVIVLIVALAVFLPMWQMVQVGR